MSNEQLAMSNERKQSKLDELIQQYCPNGVEYRKIKDLYQRIKGTPITASTMKEIAQENGDIRVFAGGKTVIDTFEQELTNANIVRVPAVSRFGWKRASLKKSVIEKMQTFFEKYSGLGIAEMRKEQQEKGSAKIYPFSPFEKMTIAAETPDSFQEEV